MNIDIYDNNQENSIYMIVEGLYFFFQNMIYIFYLDIDISSIIIGESR